MSSKIPAENPQHPDELAQLPHGRHGLPAEFVEHNQRERLIASFTALVGKVGYSGATITAVTEGAGVASRTFYKYFDSIDEVCVAAFEKGVEDLRPLVIAAYRSEAEWPRRIRAVLAAFLAEFAAYPELARLLIRRPSRRNGTEPSIAALCMAGDLRAGDEGLGGEQAGELGVGGEARSSKAARAARTAAATRPRCGRPRRDSGRRSSTAFLEGGDADVVDGLEVLVEGAAGDAGASVTR